MFSAIRRCKARLYNNKPGTEQVQALADISCSALCCYSNETCAPIANLPNSAQLECTPYHSSIQPFGHNRNGPKIGALPPVLGGKLDPHLAQRGPDRGLPPCQVPS